MDRPTSILIPQKGNDTAPICRNYYEGSVCGLNKGHSNAYHMAFGIDGKIPLLLWLTAEADLLRLTPPPTYEPPTIYPRLDTDVSDIEQWIR